MYFTFKKLSLCGCLVLSIAALSACDMYAESRVRENKIELQQSEFSERINVGEFSADTAAALAHDYSRNGEGALDLTILYDPKSRKSTAMSAGNDAARISDLLRKQGINTVQSSILPIKNHGDHATALVNFTAYKALPPAGCGVMDGIKTTQIEADPDYKLGCSIDTLFTKQIARPKDLKGNTGSGVTDGRSATNIIDAHRSGAPKPPLTGKTATTN